MSCFRLERGNAQSADDEVGVFDKLVQLRLGLFADTASGRGVAVADLVTVRLNSALVERVFQERDFGGAPGVIHHHYVDDAVEKVFVRAA